jgi:hypothetical protein
MLSCKAASSKHHQSQILALERIIEHIFSHIDTRVIFLDHPDWICLTDLNVYGGILYEAFLYSHGLVEYQPGLNRDFNISEWLHNSHSAIKLLPAKGA